MKTVHVVTLALACSIAAHADFSYTQTRKNSGGMMGGMMQGQNPVSKHYLKGQKIKIDSGNTVMIMDMEAGTMTSINNQQKTYTVTNFADLMKTMKDSGAEVQIDVKDTGQRKNINGFDSRQMIMTMSMESPQAPGMKMQMEVETWLSKDVPGAAEALTFYQKNGDKMGYAMGAGNPQMAQQMAAIQRKLAGVGGVPVMQVVRMKSGGAGAPSDAQMQQAQQGMQQAMAQLEAMKKAGGAQAQAAEQAMARMGGMRGMASGGGGGSLFEVTTESSAFSSASIPDSVFEIPAGYTKK